MAVEVSNLTKRFGSLVAVDSLDLEVKDHTIHGFLGPNGAGKTTTIKVLIGLLRPDSGLVKVLGQELGWDKPDLRTNVGYLPELPKLPKYLKGLELLDVYGRMFGMTKEKRESQTRELLKLVGLEERGDDLVGTYSKGMQQRLGLAQALLNEPKLVILDEPSLGLDPIGMIEIRDIIKNLAKKNITVFLSSHLLNEVEQICSHVTVIDKGIALASGSIKEISSKLKVPLEIEAEVDNLSKAVIRNLKKLSCVKDVLEDGNNLRIKLETQEDVRSEVSQAISSGGGIVLSMNLKGGSLEDIFLNLLAKKKGSEQ
ncbi:ABC transporter ATP-binding protein [Candidatus Bathyarchaeota archaeon]|nr:ABC transporter ATP-binding protein [Candidatus Bathyarchaeota archaeon]